MRLRMLPDHKTGAGEGAASLFYIKSGASAGVDGKPVEARAIQQSRGEKAAPITRLCASALLAIFLEPERYRSNGKKRLWRHKARTHLAQQLNLTCPSALAASTIALPEIRRYPLGSDCLSRIGEVRGLPASQSDLGVRPVARSTLRNLSAKLVFVVPLWRSEAMSRLGC